jgi:hypothetical protein
MARPAIQSDPTGKKHTMTPRNGVGKIACPFVREAAKEGRKRRWGVNLGSLELNDFLPAIERDGNFKIHLDVLARVPDRGFGAEKFIEVFALDVLSIHQAIDSDAKRESHHCGTRKPAGVTPQTPVGG